MDTSKCPNCGNYNSVFADRCSFCGKKLSFIKPRSYLDEKVDPFKLARLLKERKEREAK